MDALAALPAAAACYGVTAMQPHLSLVWRTLKAELLSPATGLPDEVKAAQQVCAATVCVAVLKWYFIQGPTMSDQTSLWLFLFMRDGKPM